LEQNLPSTELENENLKVLIKPDGSLDVLDKKTGHWFENQHYFEESGESGNPWIHMFPEENQIITTTGSEAKIEHLESSEFLTRYSVQHKMEIPAGLEGDEGNYRRSESKIQMIITSILTLRKGQNWLDIHTSIDNQAEQHRVRACFPTGLNVEKSAAESAFDVIERPIIRTPDSLYYNKENPQYPMHRFVDMSDGETGLAVFNDGIREYEAVDDDKRTLAITLFRGFTATQSPVIDQWDVYPWMKLSQSLGLNEWRYAIMPHAGDWKRGNLYREVDKFQLPLESAQAGKGGKDLPKSLSFLEIQSDDIVLSALKKHEIRETLVLRLFNPTEGQIKTQVRLYSPIKKAWLANMNEEQRKEIEPSDPRTIDLIFEHKKILTVEIELEKI